MAEMKGIKLCGECGNYDWKKHKCKIGCNDDSNAQASFYGDCPLPDVVPKSEVKNGVITTDNLTLEDVIKHYQKEYARKIFAEIETVLCSKITPCIIDGKIVSVNLDGLYIRFEDYETIKKKYTEVG